VLHGVTAFPTSWRVRAAGLALVAAAGGACAAESDTTPPDPPAAIAAPGDAPAPEARGQAHEEFKRRFEAREFAAAADQARKVVELTERDRPGHSEELQVAVMNLALAEYRAADYVAAEASYQRVIELIEASGRLASPRLGRAYGGLATTYHAARRHDLAAPAFERAIALHRRAVGLFDEGQLPLLEKQADSLTELERAEEALLAHRYALRVVGRRHGEKSLPYARQLETVGRWYTRVRAYEAGRATLRRATSVVESTAGADSPELAGPLTGLAENARRWLLDPQARAESAADEERRAMFHDATLPAPPGITMSTIAAEGLKALERAAAIVDASPDSSPTLVAGVHSQLGDWHQARQLPDEARPHYQRAWHAAGAAPEGAALQQALFGAPALIRYLVPDGWDRYARRPPEEVERRHVEIELTVTAAGGVRDPRAVSGTDDERLVAQALRSVETARYRPRLVDGAPVDTEGVRFVQAFYVLRKDEPAETPPPSSPPGQGGG
jgi:tetratricopeptide (TPR) repeat protein